MTLGLSRSYNFIRCRVQDSSLQFTACDNTGAVLDAFSLSADSSPGVAARITAEADASEVQRGGRFRTDFYVDAASDLDTVSFTLEYAKDSPPGALLAVEDAQPSVDGIQIEQGALGGSVAVNSADNTEGILAYREEKIIGRGASRVKAASIRFMVPDDEPITAFYLVPKISLHDASGREIPCFMGGVKVTIKP
jgi:hypothetical protein